MKKQYLLFNFSVAIFLLIGCIGNIPNDSRTNTPDATITPLLISPTPTNPQNASTAVTYVCPKEVNDLYQQIPPGIIVALKGDGTGFFLWDVDANTKKDLPEEANQPFPPNPRVSPDRKWLAYFEYLVNEENTLGPVRLTVIDSEGKVVTSTENTWESWTGLVGWLDNSRLIVDQFGLGDSPHPTLTLNPFTNTANSIIADYPHIYKTSHNYMSWWGPFATTMTIYDSSLSRVIYPASPSEIVLFDINNKQELARFDIGNPTGSAPQWSPDNQEFAVDISSRGSSLYDSYYSDEIYVVDRNGKISKLTNFTNTFPIIDIQEYSWSPDGRQIAFWYSINPKEKKYELATLDVSTKKVTTYCVTDYVRVDALRVFSPIWSPDGNKLLVRGKIGDENSTRTDKDSTIILVDISKYYLSQIENNAVPLGWMVDSH